VRLLDEAALLACAAYVDLNPIRAALAETPETSAFTGAKERMDDLAAASVAAQATPHQRARIAAGERSGWLSPIQCDEAHDPTGPDVCDSGRRASRKGFLPCSLESYLELLDWTGRQLRSDQRGSIPAHLSPILERIGLDGAGWCDLVRRFGRLYKRSAGTAEHLASEAQRRGQQWMQAPGNPLSTAS
jgi:hypothetical protein